MLPVHQAQEIVLSTVRRMPVEEVPLAESLDRILAEEIVPEIDLPPFDRSRMDGYAVRGEDVKEVPATLRVTEIIPAGRVPKQEVGPGEAAQIMTGAPIPAGADTVVIVEETEPAGEEGFVRILRSPPLRANISFRGEELRRGAPALRPGIPIRPVEVAILATLGRSRPTVARRPTVSVLTTGDEIVEVDRKPEGAQIRDGNSWTIAARLRRMGIEADRLGIARDDRTELRRLIEKGLERDLLILSGGVSAGAFDMVPDILCDCGVELLFRRVRMKPGKPTVFGRHEGGCVFGLPGNPVSAQVAMELLVIPALSAMMGAADPLPRRCRAVLAENVRHRGDRDVYRPVELIEEEVPARARPVTFHGSGDLMGLARANALAILPEGETTIAAGTEVTILRLDR